AVLGDTPFHVGRRKIEGVRIDVAEERRRAESRDDARRGAERERRRDDLVAVTDVECPQRGERRAGARRHAAAVSGPGVTRERLLERGHARPENETLAIADFENRALDVGAQRSVLILEIE